MNRESGGLLRGVVLPRLVYLPYAVAKVALFLAGIVQRLRGFRPRGAQPTLCIEAGVRGWQSIEFKEIYQSACEYLAPENVHQLVVQPGPGYLEQVTLALRTRNFSHYLYDPRTGSQRVLQGMWQSLRIALLLQSHGVIPLVFLTDPSIRKQRAQAAMVSARKGIVFCMMAPRRISPIFPHRRLAGPSLMPFSSRTMSMLDALIANRERCLPKRAVFSGSLYEPRTTVLAQIKTGLSARGHIFDVQGRVAGGPRVPDAEYWSRLCNADIVVTTAEQVVIEGADWSHIPQLVYRFLEVLACETLLVAPTVPAVCRYFVPGVHFVSFDTAQHAVEMVSHFLENDADRLRIARQGKARAAALVSSRSFWMLLDSSLAADSMY